MVLGGVLKLKSWISEKVRKMDHTLRDQSLSCRIMFQENSVVIDQLADQLAHM